MRKETTTATMTMKKKNIEKNGTCILNFILIFNDKRSMMTIKIIGSVKSTDTKKHTLIEKKKQKIRGALVARNI